MENVLLWARCLAIGVHVSYLKKKTGWALFMTLLEQEESR